MKSLIKSKNKMNKIKQTHKNNFFKIKIIIKIKDKTHRPTVTLESGDSNLYALGSKSI